MEIIENKFIVRLVEDIIDVNEAINCVNHCKSGAVSLFMGITRSTESDDSTGRQVKGLVYEAYHSMAIKQMKEIIERNISEYNDKEINKCFVVHRLGRVCVGQTSILIACSSPHRREGHELVLKLLNDIKAFVPIWKRIIWETTDGTDGHTGEEWSDKSDAFWLNG